MNLEFQEKSTKETKLIETSDKPSFTEIADKEQPVSNSVLLPSDQANLEQTRLTELLNEAKEQTNKDKTLQESCLNSLDFLKDFTPENYGKTQGELLGSVGALSILALLFAALVIPILVYRCYTIGFTYPKTLGPWSSRIILPFLGAIPAISLLGNWLDRKHYYRTAEACHPTMLGISHCLPQTNLYRYYAELELAEFYMSLGKQRQDND